MAAPAFRGQGLVSLAVLVVLAMAAAWLVDQAAEPQPAVKSFLAAAPGEPAAARGGAAAGGSPLAGLAAAGLEPMGPAEAFGPDDLYVKINGKADLYLTSGFESLHTRRYSLAGRPEAWLEAYAYRMASPAAAFAVYSQQRRPGAQPLELAALAYATANSVYALSGAGYLEIIGSGPDQELLRAARRLAAAWADRAGGEGGAGLPSELAWLPAEGLEPGSRALLRSGAFGFAGLDEVYLARYRLPAGPAAAFVSRRDGPAAARELAGAYAEFILANGGAERGPPAGAPEGSRLFDLIGLYELIFTRGPLLAGVHEASSPADAAALAGRLAAGLPEPEP